MGKVNLREKTGKDGNRDKKRGGIDANRKRFPELFPPDKNAYNVVEIEAGMMKQCFSSRSWIDETIRC